MARCDEGYCCQVCGRDVERIVDSDLYLRYILGEVRLEQLHLHPERHIRCNPELAQYIQDPAFPPIHLSGGFSKAALDADYVCSREREVTQAWQRLQALPSLGLTLAEYPLGITPVVDQE